MSAITYNQDLRYVAGIEELPNPNDESTHTKPNKRNLPQCFNSKGIQKGASYTMLADILVLLASGAVERVAFSGTGFALGLQLIF